MADIRLNGMAEAVVGDMTATKMVVALGKKMANLGMVEILSSGASGSPRLDQIHPNGTNRGPGHLRVGRCTFLGSLVVTKVCGLG